MSNGTALAVIESYRDKLTRMEPQFTAALPVHVRPERFARVAMSALSSVKVADLVAADSRSVLGAVMKCAQDGLMLDGREAALVFYKGACQYLPMVRGIMKLARNSGDVSKIVAQVVYEHDEFEIQFVADGPPITHRPNLDDRGTMVGVYALAKLRDGEWTDPEWMTREQVEKIRQRSYARNSGPWVSDYEQMALKTVIKRAAKRWPASTDLDDLLHADDGEYESPSVEGAVAEDGVVDFSNKRASRASRVVLGRNKPLIHDGVLLEAVDEETGEVVSSEPEEEKTDG